MVLFFAFFCHLFCVSRLLLLTCLFPCLLKMKGEIRKRTEEVKMSQETLSMSDEAEEWSSRREMRISSERRGRRRGLIENPSYHKYFVLWFLFFFHLSVPAKPKKEDDDEDEDDDDDDEEKQDKYSSRSAKRRRSYSPGRESIEVRRRKQKERESRRRSRLNTLFQELGSLIGADDADKATILEAAVKALKERSTRIATLESALANAVHSLPSSPIRAAVAASSSSSSHAHPLPPAAASAGAVVAALSAPPPPASSSSLSYFAPLTSISAPSSSNSGFPSSATAVAGALSPSRRPAFPHSSVDAVRSSVPVASAACCDCCPLFAVRASSSSASAPPVPPPLPHLLLLRQPFFLHPSLLPPLPLPLPLLMMLPPPLLLILLPPVYHPLLLLFIMLVIVRIIFPCWRVRFLPLPLWNSWN